MIENMIIVSAVLLLSIFSSKLFYRFGVPSLLIFLALGMLFGRDGLMGLSIADYDFAKEVCSVGLAFIMFFGGFSTNWKHAKPIAIPAILMSTFGVIATAGLTGLFCHFVLQVSLLEGLLIGSIISSTDAASVFSILRSRKLNLKNGLASLLEIESGSNDPFAYLLTITILTLMGKSSAAPLEYVLLQQLVYGILIGLFFAAVTGYILKSVILEIDGFYPIFVIATVLLAFSLCEVLGGNAFLCVYLFGIILGNSKIMHKRSLVHFFDGISWLMQILLFFTLGLLSLPSHIPDVIFPGILVSLFLVFIARPIATFSILSWFKVPIKNQLLVSWVGLRGAASLVFSIYAMASGLVMRNDIFHIVFFVAIFSVAIQGSLMPRLAKRLDLVDDNDAEDAVLKTFNDYRDDLLNKLIEIKIGVSHPWANKTIIDANIPDSILVLMIKHNDEYITPKGYSMIRPGDMMVLSGNVDRKELKKIEMGIK